MVSMSDQRRVGFKPEHDAAIELHVGFKVQQPMHVDGVQVAPRSPKRARIRDAGATAREVEDLHRLQTLAYRPGAIGPHTGPFGEFHHLAALGGGFDVVGAAIEQRLRNVDLGRRLRGLHMGHRHVDLHFVLGVGDRAAGQPLLERFERGARDAERARREREREHRHAGRLVKRALMQAGARGVAGDEARSET